MPTRVASVLGSYDLFAKTIPGTLFFIALVSLSPSIPDVSLDGASLGVISILFIVTAVSGLIIGQALHSVAVAGETAGYKLTRIIHDSSTRARTSYWKNYQKMDPRSPENTLSKEWPFIETELVLRRLFGQIYCWIVNRVNEVVLPHRVWFKKRLRDEFGEGNEADGLYDWFKLQSRNQLKSMDMDLVEEHEKIYRFVMSYLRFVNSGRARKFQATSSFCRSTWLTLLTFAIVYVIIILGNVEPIIGYSPVIEPVLVEYGYSIPVGLFTGTLLFMYSAGQYKKHFTEYIVVDFYNAVENNSESKDIKLDVEKLDVNLNDK
ncbi:hypothetical protein [Halorubrum aethiopicum]|uniref:hypothetical protein n=1 Tax=Halorubrum aethiopicum TaxID=1758255 RepID=UPI000A503577|nr:hypothetical protein [Halorubrum aethiopicum]